MLSSLLLSLLVVMLLPFVAKAPLAVAMHKSGGYDNNNPREQQAALKGFGQRANAAHYNSFEALMIFTAAVVIAVAAGKVDQLSATLGWVFVACRVGYLCCYWFNIATLRSLIWFVATAAAFTIAARALLG